MNHDRFDILIRKYQNDELEGAEKELMDQWFDSLDTNQDHRWTTTEIESLKRKIMAKIEQKDQPVSSRSAVFKEWVPYAAAILLFATLGSVYYLYYRTNEVHVPSLSDVQILIDQGDVEPGKNKATLTMADGTTIDLSETHSGIIMDEGKIRYENGKTVLDVDNNRVEEEIPYATLSVPRGGQYQVLLPDGSKVWLNSASSLRYPLRFSESERVVELEGEAYFEVAGQQNLAGKRIPFKVLSTNQVIDVLGTKFNVLAYTDEADTRTVLVSGSVRVSKPDRKGAKVLLPGEESLVGNSSDIKVRPVNVEAAIAWKSGIFHFDETPFPQMLKQIARWYDIDVVYEGVQPKDVFSGKMSRNVNLQVLVKFLRDSGIKLQIEGKKLIVKNKN